MDGESLRESIATVRTRIDDLQSEMEAGARCADHIRTDVKVMDSRVVNHVHLTTRLTALLERADELKKSIEEQQLLLRELRASFDQLRQSLRQRSK